MSGQTDIRIVKVDAAGRKVRIDRLVVDSFNDLSRERIKQLILDGNLQVDEEKIDDPAWKSSGNITVRLAIPPAAPDKAVPQDIPLDIVHEDAHLIVIDKPAGLVVHPAAGHADGTLVNALLYHCPDGLSGIGGVQRPGIVHRIDKDTSGLMVAAKTDEAHRGLSALFAAHDIERKYLAFVSGHPKPPAGTVTGNIGRSPKNRKKMAVVEDGRGKHATTHYRTTEMLDGAALVECQLETGRTHQVRVHMAHIGHSLLGDPLYGGARKNSLLRRKDIHLGRQALHAAILGFEHPVTGEKMRFSSQLPDDLQQLFSALRV